MSTKSTMTLKPLIHIIGAGVSDLTIARCLRKRGIASVVFEKNPSPARHTYGITLREWAWRPLVEMLG